MQGVATAVVHLRGARLALQELLHHMRAIGADRVAQATNTLGILLVDVLSRRLKTGSTFLGIYTQKSSKTLTPKALHVESKV